MPLDRDDQHRSIYEDSSTPGDWRFRVFPSDGSSLCQVRVWHFMGGPTDANPDYDFTIPRGLLDVIGQAIDEDYREQSGA